MSIPKISIKLNDKQKSYRRICWRIAHVELFQIIIIRLWRARDEQMGFYLISFVNINFRDEMW